MKRQHLSAAAGIFVLLSLGEVLRPPAETAATRKPPGSPLDISAIERIIGRKGVAMDGQFRVTIPQNDLNMQMDGFRINPAMGLGTWVAFASAGRGARVMGDIIALGQEVQAVEREIVAQGLRVTALHNHFLRESPRIMYLHISGRGQTDSLAVAVKHVFDTIASLRHADPAQAAAAEVENSLDTQKISGIMGYSGEMNHGVYKITISRPDVNLSLDGNPVTAFMGFNTWAAWQGAPAHAAVAGDFAMLANEVPRVIEALVRNGIEVVAVHNHMINESPPIIFLHYWGTGDALALARGLRAALDETSGGN